MPRKSHELALVTNSLLRLLYQENGPVQQGASKDSSLFDVALLPLSGRPEARRVLALAEKVDEDEFDEIVDQVVCTLRAYLPEVRRQREARQAAYIADSPVPPVVSDPGLTSEQKKLRALRGL